MGAQPAVLESEHGYPVSAVARRLGVATATLRTWDRRYGISPSLRTNGSHRRYTEQDLALLQRMRTLMLAGMAPGDAARAAQSDLPGAVADAPRDAQRPPEGGTGRPAAASKGAVLQQRGLYRAACCMDAAAASDLIRGSLERKGVVWTWDEVIAPVMRGIGEKYAADGTESASIDIEHHLSHIVIRELIRSNEVARPVNPRPVLLAAAPGEEHTLPLYALAAALAERSIETRLLGGRTPDAALAAAVRRTGPVAVFIWAQSRPGTLLEAAVPAVRPAPAIVVGGPGWQGCPLPQGVAQPLDLAEAVSAVVAATRASRQ